MTLQEAREHIGARVVYRDGLGRCEYGYISSVNALYVFVRYDGDSQGKATMPEMLRLV